MYVLVYMYNFLLLHKICIVKFARADWYPTRKSVCIKRLPMVFIPIRSPNQLSIWGVPLFGKFAPVIWLCSNPMVLTKRECRPLIGGSPPLWLVELGVRLKGLLRFMTMITWPRIMRLPEHGLHGWVDRCKTALKLRPFHGQGIFLCATLN